MGSFYSNITIRTENREGVLASLMAHGRSAYVTPVLSGSVVVFDKACEQQDLDELENLCKLLSKDLNAGVLGVLNHDDDVLILLTATGGELVDVYNSCPAYFSGEGSESPEGGNAEAIVNALAPGSDAGALETALRDEEDLFAAVERHEAIIEALGLPMAGVGMGFEYVSEEPEELSGLDASELIRIT